MMKNNFDSSWKNQVNIVLVNPEDNLNIGSVARVMANFEFCNLCVVEPSVFDKSKAQITARFAEFILDGVKFHDSLESALANSTIAVAFSSQCSKYRRGHIDLKEWIEAKETVLTSPLHLVFGPESSGLSLAHTSLCKAVVRLPTSESFPSMNLSHAIATVLCSLILHKSGRFIEQYDLANGERYQALDNLIMDSGTKSGFFREGHRAEIQHVLQNVFRRASLTNWEMDIVTGLFGRFNKKF